MYKRLERELWSDDLKKIKPALKSLYYKGNIDLVLNNSPKLAVVGTRRMTDYAAGVIEGWMPSLVGSGITIVSGFMYGVDQKAHWECIKNGGRTIAVLGWGIDWKFSDKDVEIYQKIIETDGLILSEYEGEETPERWKFPQRNRIVVGVSDAVWVLEGADKSGSMITAKLSKKFGKTLLALPGAITSKVSEGTNRLIKTGEAKMVTMVSDILSEMGLKPGQMSLVGIGQ